MANPVLSTLTGGRPDWTQQTPPSSKKGLWAAIAAVVVVGIVAGGFLLYRRQQSTSPESRGHDCRAEHTRAARSLRPGG